MDINLNTAKNDNKKYLYKKDDLYFEFNNVEHYNIVWINCIYNYYAFYLKFKITNNFFFRIIFKLIKKTYIEKETRY